jgi:2-dehydropantoate 2-reductase
VLFCTKDYGLEAAARSLLPVIGPQTVVLPLLNGVDAAERLGALLGAEHMVGGTVFVAASIREPGLIAHTNLDRLIFGELDGGVSPRCEAVLAAFHDHGIPTAELSTDIRLELWKKYLFLNAMAGVGSVVRKPLGAWRGEPETRRLYEACMQETEAVARVLGIALPESIVTDTLTFTDGRPPEIIPSMAYDLMQGKPLELEALQGTMMRLGRETGVPTPGNDFIHAALVLWADGG